MRASPPTTSTFQLDVNSSERVLYSSLSFRWWSYDALVEKLYILSTVPSIIVIKETVWSYDNSERSEPYTCSWSEIWSNPRYVSLRIASSGEQTSLCPDVVRVALTNMNYILPNVKASIPLNSNITITDVASCGVDLTISTEEHGTVR